MTITVIKRNGKQEEYDHSKVVQAVDKARIEIGNGDINLPIIIAHLVLEEITSLGDVVSFEKIHDLVEVSLMGKSPEVAKAYILYRDKRNKERGNGEQWKMNDLQHSIWDKKYKFEDKELGILESFRDWLDRIANGNATLRKIMQEQKFLFGGRILSNRDLNKHGRKVTYSNCYVLPRPKDNLESIFDTARDMARTYSYGGGVGISLKKLRPRNFRVHNNAKDTSGAVSFMPIYSLTTETIGQNGRRGALMLSIPSSHPDLEEFINVKTDLTQVTGANISIEIDDAFMNAVKNKALYRLHFEAETGETFEKYIEANKFYRKIIKNNLDYAEPGMLFWDTITQNHLMSADERFEYEGTNPCAEEPLPGGGSCLLGSINLSALVKNPFTSNAVFDFSEYVRVIRESVKGLNEVLDEGLPFHPLEIQRKTVGELRQIGLGVMGIADMLIKLGVTYGSKESLDFCDTLAHTLLQESLKASADYAEQYGSFDWYDWDNLSNSKFFQEKVEPEVQAYIKERGLRNSQVLCIAPTGSISTMLGISGGIEPTFSFSYTRTTKSLHGKDVTYEVFADIVEQYREVTGDKRPLTELPEYFVASHQLNWKQRIEMQSVWQNFIDASISSTINLPSSVGVDEALELYLYAWEKGLKGATIFREGGFREGILKTTDADKKDSEEMTEEEHQEWLERIAEREEKLDDQDRVTTGYYSTCPECSSNQMFQSAGCVTCQDCGFSPCS